MVIRIPDFSGDIHTKGRVLVPCQCLYNPHGDFLTEINHYEPINKKSYPHPAHTNQKHKHCGSETATYSRNENSDLWDRQFNRWWGWNWQRKRKEFLRKFGIKSCQSCAEKSNFKEEPTNECKTNPKTDVLNRNPSTKYCKVHSRELLHSFAPLPPFYTCGLRKQYTGRRRRRKRDQRENQPWLREITSSSDSDPPVKTSCRRFKDRSLQQQCSYFKKRLRNINSDESVELAAMKLTKTEFKSPVSGQIYNLSQPKLTVCTGESKTAEYLDPVSIKNDYFLPKFEFEWLEKYNLMKKEHTTLITTICEMICASYAPIGKTPVPSKKAPETINVASTENLIDMYHVNPKIAPDAVYNTNWPTQIVPQTWLSPTMITPNSVPPETTQKNSNDHGILKEIPTPKANHLFGTNINITQPRSDSFLIRNPEKIDTLYAIQSDPNQNSRLRACESIILSNSSYEDAHDSNYDLNYIENNLSSFTSFISDIEFMVCEPEMAVNKLE